MEGSERFEATLDERDIEGVLAVLRDRALWSVVLRRVSEAGWPELLKLSRKEGIVVEVTVTRVRSRSDV